MLIWKREARGWYVATTSDGLRYAITQDLYSNAAKWNLTIRQQGMFLFRGRTTSLREAKRVAGIIARERNLLLPDAS